MASQAVKKGAHQELQIKATDELVRGVYANVITCSIGQHEVTLDFVHVEPQASDPEGTKDVGYLVSRVILSKSNLTPLIDLLTRQRAKIEGEEDAQSAS